MSGPKKKRSNPPGTFVIRFLLSWLVLAFAVWVAASVVDGIRLDGWESTLVVAGILGLLNAVLRPIAFFVSLPITCLTLGVFVLVLNTGMLALTALIAGQIDGVRFTIDGFWSAFFGALVITAVSWVLGWVVPSVRTGRR